MVFVNDVDDKEYKKWKERIKSSDSPKEELLNCMAEATNQYIKSIDSLAAERIFNIALGMTQRYISEES